MSQPSKLSALIREGAKLRPQGFVHVYHDGKTNAIGAAYEALTGERPPDDTLAYGVEHLIEEAFRNAGVSYHTFLLAEITRRSLARQSREKIADWVEEAGY